MLKNFSVGLKMAIGFGVVILLMLVSAVITYSGTIQLNKLLYEIEALSELQAEINQEMESFHEARLLGRTIILEIDHEAYLDYQEQAAQALTGLARIQELAAESSPELLMELTGLQEDLQTWIAHIDTVQEYNTDLEQRQQTITTLSTRLSGYGSTLFEDVLADLQLCEVLPAGQLISTAELIKQLELIRLESAEVLLVFETEDITALVTRMDSTLQRIDNLPTANLRTQASNGLAQIRTTLELYRQEVIDFAAVSEASDVEHETPAYALAGDISDRLVLLSQDAESLLATHIESALRVGRLTLWVTVISTALAVLFAVVIAIRITQRLTRPLKRMQQLLQQLSADGNMHFTEQQVRQIEADAAIRDEVGRSVHSLWALLQRLLAVSSCLEQVAARDLTARIEPLGEQDTMGLALERMADNLNEVFQEIHQAGDTVAAGANHLASSAHNLAQMNAEQAAAVEELYATINDVAVQAQKSGERTVTAVAHSRTVEQMANEGGEKISDLLQSLQEINDSGRAVQKIIKTIDEIAFQTNILALNTAVEAARAGQYGKGFAVVAGEVRSLASKSAEAAKETAQIIANSQDKAAQSLMVGEDAAQSFAEISKGIQQTGRDIGEINRIMEDQAQSIGQVNVGVKQIADSVQQNSRTSEETAAASQEMSGQANQLHSMLSLFQLRQAEAEAAPAASSPTSESATVEKRPDPSALGRYL